MVDLVVEGCGQVREEVGGVWAGVGIVEHLASYLQETWDRGNQ